jgi:alpha-glucosidase
MQLQPAVTNLRWPEHDVIYEIYLPTFCETLRPGTLDQPSDVWRGRGNLRGVIAKLGYLAHDLGVNAIWLTPFYPSGGVDGGYDVTDFTDIDPAYGTLADFEQLTAVAHERGLKVMVDLTPNHTSIQHSWFQESRQSRDNPRADWYIWRDPAPGGGVPNNWGTVFSAPSRPHQPQDEQRIRPGLTPYLTGWQWDETRGQYYLHSFAPEQPDLNWANPAVRQAFQDVMRFWVQRGVDGFRIDAVNYIGKDPEFRDESFDPTYHDGQDNPYDQLTRQYSCGFPDTFYEYLHDIAAAIDDFPEHDLRIVFEAYMPLEALDRINQVHRSATTFNFTRLGVHTTWQADTHRDALEQYYATLPTGAIPNQVNGNHDRPRLATRFGERQARAAALLNLTLPGEIYLYNGEEGGFTNVPVPPERQQDKLDGRDPERTPMLWTGEQNAGFSQATADALWLPVDPDYALRNLAVQAGDPESSLQLYRRLIQLRRTTPVLQNGIFVPLRSNYADVLSFGRELDQTQAVILVNFSGEPKQAQIVGVPAFNGRVAASSLRADTAETVDLAQGVSLLPYEAVVIL